MRLIDADALERDGWSLQRTHQKDKEAMVYEVKAISEIPTVQPYTDDEIQKMQELEQAQIQKAYELGREDAQPEQQWTLCSEGTPKKTDYYICTCHDGARYRTSALKWSTGWVLTGARSYWKVIAWMPLPEPYKGEE